MRYRFVPPAAIFVLHMALLFRPGLCMAETQTGDSSPPTTHPSHSFEAPVTFYLNNFDALTGGKQAPESLAAFENLIAESPEIYRGALGWTVQTYAILKERGFDVRFSGGSTFPKHGVVIGHNDTLFRTARRRHVHKWALRHLEMFAESRWLPHDNFVVAIKADRWTTCHAADLHIVQNRADPLYKQTNGKTAFFMGYWPQFSLTPRDPKRGERFENITFQGWRPNLAPELRSQRFADSLSDLGLRLHIVDETHRSKWSNYSDVDAVLAVRGFPNRRDHVIKPASKLVNAWHAGVPAVLGDESAFKDLRKSDLDYIEVTSVRAAIQALTKLRDNPSLRKAMVAHGKERAEAFTHDVIAKHWVNFISTVAVPAYLRQHRPRRLTASPNMPRNPATERFR